MDMTDIRSGIELDLKLLIRSTLLSKHKWQALTLDLSWLTPIIKIWLG